MDLPKCETCGAAIPPDAPLGLAAAVRDRRQTSFQLSWTAPADNGQPVTGYEVRYARVPINAGNFDDTSVTTALTYTDAPAAPGSPDGIAATGQLRLGASINLPAPANSSPTAAVRSRARSAGWMAWSASSPSAP